MKCVAVALLKSMLIEKVGVISYFSNLVTDLGKLWIIVPLS